MRFECDLVPGRRKAQAHAQYRNNVSVCIVLSALIVQFIRDVRQAGCLRTGRSHSVAILIVICLYLKIMKTTQCRSLNISLWKANYHAMLLWICYNDTCCLLHICMKLWMVCWQTIRAITSCHCIKYTTALHDSWLFTIKYCDRYQIFPDCAVSCLYPFHVYSSSHCCIRNIFQIFEPVMFYHFSSSATHHCSSHDKKFRGDLSGRFWRK